VIKNSERFSQRTPQTFQEETNTIRTAQIFQERKNIIRTIFQG